MAQKYILLLDKNNFIGSLIAENLQGKASMVLVTAEKVVGDGGAIIVAFTHPVPQIPEGDYGSISLVWDESAVHLLDPLLRKANEQKIPFFIIYTHEQQEKVLEYQDKALLLELGDLFGAMPEQPLDVFLRSVKSKKRAVLSGMGLHLWRPVLFSDAIKTIVEIVLESRGKSVFVGPPHGVTALGLSHSLQKMDPDIVIDFSTEPKEVVEDYIVGPSAMPQYDSISSLKNFYSLLRVKREKRVVQEEKILLTRDQGKKVKHHGKLTYVFYVLLILFVLPFLIVGVSGAFGAMFLSAGIHDGERGSFAGAEQEITAAQANFTVAKNAAALLEMAIPPLDSFSYFKSLKQQVSLGEQVSQVAKDGLDAGQKLSGILSGKAVSPQDDSEQVIGDLKHAQLLISSVKLSDLPSQYRSLFSAVQKIGTVTSSVVDELPQLLGVKGERSYLVLFLNNMELRPGGGFIGSYGLLRLKNGAVKDFTIHDVYDADGQLKGHVEPPFAIRRYVPIVHLYLRDSNFDPDFGNDAMIAASLLSQETGDRVDGVFGVDLNAFQNLLTATGSIYVPSYNQTVTDANFFQMLETHAEKNFFPGSTQKKDFLRSVASALQAKLQKEHSMNGQMLLMDTLNSLMQKHVVISFADPSLQEPFALTNLSGTVPQASASGQLNDFFGIVEANLGINKANAYIGRQLTQNVEIAGNGDVTSTSLLTLTNSSDGSWPGGPYKNYIRFMLPENAVLKGVALDDVEQNMIPAVTDPKQYESKSFIAPRGLEVEKEMEKGKALYGFLVTVPIKKSLSIKITYTMPKAFAVDQLSQNYNLLLWKQVGVSPFPYSLTIRMPSSYRLLSSSVPFDMQNQEMSYSGLLDNDTAFALSLAKK